MLEVYNVSIEIEEKELTGKHLMKCVMNKWLPASTTSLEMCIVHLPSPYEPQSYCVENLYKGLGDDDYAQGIRNCDTRAPLMVYASKMIPTHVKVVDCKDRVKLRKGLECLVKSDLSVVCTSTEDKTVNLQYCGTMR
ncbi:hypothetical protein Tco_0588700 [Tanacetum coccineum]